MRPDLEAIKARLTAVTLGPWVDFTALICEVEHLTAIAEAADEWATALKLPDGVYNAERKLVAEVEAWRKRQ